MKPNKKTLWVLPVFVLHLSTLVCYVMLKYLKYYKSSRHCFHVTSIIDL